MHFETFLLAFRVRVKVRVSLWSRVIMNNAVLITNGQGSRVSCGFMSCVERLAGKNTRCGSS